MHTRSQLLLAILAICAVLMYSLACAQASEGARAVTPPSEDSPVKVAVGLYVVDISHISEVDNTFQTEFDIIAFWNDPRLAFDAAAEGSDRRIYIGEASSVFGLRYGTRRVTRPMPSVE
jgi:hypothetical protein